MESTVDIERLIKRHSDFWRMKPVDHPLSSVVPYRSTQLSRAHEKSVLGFREGDIVTPEAITEDRFIMKRPEAVIEGDYFQGVGIPGVLQEMFCYNGAWRIHTVASAPATS